MPESGYLLLFDLSGYTEFLTRSDLAQAPGILESLLGTVADRIRPPLTVAELEGDAIFAWAPDDGFAGAALLRAIDDIYGTFAAARERMEWALECTCAGCAELPRLDLKVVAHHGPFALRSIIRGQPAKPVGAEVVAAHRLLKNHVTDITGVRSYALITRRCADALGADALPPTAIPHRESYAHIGDVDGWVLDLEPAWLQERQRRLVTVAESDAWIAVAADAPARPVEIWRRIEQHAFRSAWVSGVPARSDVLPLMHAHADRCFEGEAIDVMRIPAREPLKRLTLACRWPLDATVLVTLELTATEAGTRVRAHVSEPAAATPAQAPAVRAFYRPRVARIAEECRRLLETLRDGAEQSLPT